MPVRFGYRSGDPLRMLNALIMSDRRERQSDKEMALSALMFNIKREEAEKVRVAKESQRWEDKIIDLQKTIDEKKQTVATMGGTLRAVKEQGERSGVGSDASSMVYLSMSRMAGDIEDMTNSMERAKTEYGSLMQQGQALDASIKDYHVGLGSAAASVFREYGDDAKVDKGEYAEALEKLKTDKNFNVSDWKSFETGFNKGLQELTVQAQKTQTEKDRGDYYRRGGYTRSKADKKLSEYDSLSKHWLSIQKALTTGDKSEMNVLLQELGIPVEPGKKMDPETLYRSFRRRVKLYEKKYGEKIMEDFFPTKPKDETVTTQIKPDDKDPFGIGID
jgi:hypothetical protein